MFELGEKIIYGEHGVCTVDKIGPLEMQGASPDKLYYFLSPYVGSGTIFAPVDGNAYMRHVISEADALEFIDSIPGIPAAICTDNRFNHVDAFYKELFRLHTNEALVSIIKGMYRRMAGRKTRSSRGESTLKHAKEILYGELSIALGVDYKAVDSFIVSRIGCSTEEAGE